MVEKGPTAHLYAAGINDGLQLQAVVSEVVTEGVDLTGVEESFSQTVAISYIGNYTDLKETKTVEVQVVLQPDPDYVPPQPEVESPELNNPDGGK